MVVLDVIQAAIDRPREQLNRLAPRVHIEGQVVIGARLAVS
jgi:hypothetical protein